MSADPAKLVYAGKSTEGDPVIEYHVATELRAVRKRDVVTDHTIMGDVNVGHDPVVIPNPRATLVLNRSGVDRYKFTECVAITNFKDGGLTRIFFVLRYRADHCIGMNLVI